MIKIVNKVCDIRIITRSFNPIFPTNNSHQMSSLSSSENQVPENNESVFLPLKHESQPKNYLCIRNYIIPNRPKLIKITQFLNKQHQQFRKLDTLQTKVKFQSLSDVQAEKLQKLKSQYNKLIIEKQQQYDKNFKAIKKLPYHLNMLFMYLKLTPNLHHHLAVKLSMGKREYMDENQQQQQTKQWTEQLLDIQMPQGPQLYRMLLTSHPLLRKCIFEKYEQIHDAYRFRPKLINKQMFRLPILYFNHPYELFLIEKYKQQNGTNYVQPKHFYIADETVLNYDKLWNNLDKKTQQIHHNQAAVLLSEYQKKLQKISTKINLKYESLLTLINRQYQDQQANEIESKL